MKINSTLLKCFIAILIFALPLSIFAKTTYNGRIVYNNENKTPLKGVEVFLKNLDGSIAATDFTDKDGVYVFKNIAESVYVIDVEYDAEPGDIDFTDLFLIVKHLIGRDKLEGIAYVASDVDGSGIVDWNDYWDFLVGWFVRGEDFKSGKWAFQKRTIDLNDAEMKGGGDDLMLSAGDTGGGFEPGVKNNPVGAGLSYDGIIPVTNDNNYELPIHYAGIESVGGFNLTLNYSENVIIEGVNSTIDNLNYSFENGVLKISWLNTNIGLSVINSDAPLFTIRARMMNEIKTTNIFSLSDESRFVNLEGITIHDASITMPVIDGSEVVKPELKDIYPNPVKDKAIIKYNLTATSDVTLSIFNTNGQKLGELVKAVQSAGSYQVDLDVITLNLSSGMYVYRLDCVGEQMFSESKMLIVSR